MVVNINAEGIDLFTKAGHSKERVKATVDHYRQQGLTDEEIQAKVDAKLNSLRQQYAPKQQNAFVKAASDVAKGLYNVPGATARAVGDIVASDVAEGLYNVPGAVVRAVGDIAGKIGQTAVNVVKEPVKTISSIPGAAVSGVSKSLVGLGEGIGNLPGTAVNIVAGKEVVKPSTFEDAMNLFLRREKDREIANKIIDFFRQQGKQAPVAELTGELVPYVLGGESSALTKAIPSQAGRYATIAGVGTPSTSLSERVTSAGTAAAMSPETAGGVLRAGKVISDKTGVSALDKALRDRVAGISPEAYTRIKEGYLDKANPEYGKYYVGENPIEVIFGSKNIKNEITSLNKQLSNDTQKVLEGSLPNKAELAKNINDTAYNTAKTIQKRVSDLKEKLGEEVGTAKKGLGEEKGEYLGIIKSKATGKEAAVFVNPSDKIIRDLIKDSDNGRVRYAVSDGKVYVWDANKLLHEELARELGISLESLEKRDVANSASEVSLEIKAAKARAGMFKKQPDYSLDVIKKDIKSVTDEYTPTELKAIKVNTLLNNIQKILDESASERLGVKGVSLESLNKIKKIIQDETNFNVSTTKEGKIFKDKLRRVIDDRITELAPELKEANANYSKLLKAVDDIKGLESDSLATKLKNDTKPENAALIEQLRNLDKSYPELKISELIDKLEKQKEKLFELNQFKDNPLLKPDKLKDFIIKYNKYKKLENEAKSKGVEFNMKEALLNSGLTEFEIRNYTELSKMYPDIKNIESKVSTELFELLSAMENFQGKPVTLEGVGIPAGLGALGYYSGFGGLGAGALGFGLGRLLYSPAGQRLQLGVRGAINKAGRITEKPRSILQRAVAAEQANKKKEKK